MPCSVGSIRGTTTSGKITGPIPGSIAALVVLEVLSQAGRPLSELRTDFERYADSGEINTEVAEPGEVIDAVASHYAGARQDRLDGLTVDLGEWWFNLRPSNTEPLLRLNLEAADPEACSGPHRGGPVADQRRRPPLGLGGCVPSLSNPASAPFGPGSRRPPKECC